MLKKNILTLIIGILIPLQISFAQDTLPAKEQIQLLDKQSNALINNFAKDKKALQDELNAKTKKLTNSSDDKAAKAALVQDASKKIEDLKENFKVQLDTINEAKMELIYGDRPRPPKTSARPKPVPVANLQERIKKQDAEMQASKVITPGASSLPLKNVPPQPLPAVNSVKNTDSTDDSKEINARSLKKLNDFSLPKSKMNSGFGNSSYR